MLTNPLKEKLRRGLPTFGTWLSLGNERVARILARHRFDWLTVDLEHSPVDWQTAGAIVGWIAEAGCVPLVRVPGNDPISIKRSLDLGAFGLAIPMVNTPQEAAAAVRAAKYPPVGDRSAGNGMQTLTFKVGFEQYLSQANEAVFIAAQIESALAVKNATAIASVAGIDALFVGPNDLRLRLEASPATEPPTEAATLDAAIRAVVKAAREAGRASGIHAANPQEARRYAEYGMTFIAIGSDSAMLETQADHWLRAVRQFEDQG